MLYKDLLLIMNPNAGMRRANRHLADVLALFARNGWQARVFMTTGRGDGARITQAYASGAELVVCIGGDGTLNEVIGGMIASGADRPIGYIPAGSTNDFATSLNLSKEVRAAAEDILLGTPRRFDMGSFNGRHFSYIASCGAFTRVSYATPQAAKNVLGHLAYVLEGLRDLSSLRPVPLRVETEQQVFEDEFIFAAVSNSTSIGGLLTFKPEQVLLDDGRFELMLIRHPKTPGELSHIAAALTTRQYNDEMIFFSSVRQATVFAPGDLPWTLDGEFDPGAPVIEIKNLHRAVSLIVNDTPRKNDFPDYDHLWAGLILPQRKK